MSQSSPAYRPDVDGLRAIAVLAVLAFHAFPAALPGGFVGVDAFFVISGYLISGILFEDLRRGRFTFVDFYWRRIRRIFPALILVLLATLWLGWFVLLPDEYRRLGGQIAAGAGFLSNFALWREGGYFDSASELKPLLHLWSLAVEEQYYLVWPLLLFVFRRHPGRMLWIILGLGAASFGANVWLDDVAPRAAFYLPVARFWELMVGGALAWVAIHGTDPSARFANAKSVLGAALFAGAAVALDGRDILPLGWALAPVLGAALLVSAGPGAWLNRAVLAHPAFVFVGLISYPLYLWHWPLLAYARIVKGGEPSLSLRLSILAASFALAWATYHFVERKIRRQAPGKMRRRGAVRALVASMMVIALGGVAARQSALPPQSASLPRVDEISRASEDWQYGGDRIIPGDGGSAVLFFGDSHMQHYWPRIEKIVSEHRAPLRTVILKTAGGCAPVPGIERRTGDCSQFVNDGLQLALRPEVDTVVIAASWVGFVTRPDYHRVSDPERTPINVLAPESEWVLRGFEAALRKLVGQGKRVVVVLSSPRGEAFNPKSRIDREGMTVRVHEQVAPVARAALTALTAPIDERLKRIAAATGAGVIDPADWLCSPKVCPTTDEAGRPLYKDDSHLRPAFVRDRFGAIDEYVYLKRSPQH